jgi:AraC-like DNA-binding protein
LRGAIIADRATDRQFDSSARETKRSALRFQERGLRVGGISHTEVPIAVIAERLGFDDATNFIKFFRGIESCTPGDFRRRMARDDPRARS